MTVKLLTEHNLEFLRIKGGCVTFDLDNTDSSYQLCSCTPLNKNFHFNPFTALPGELFVLKIAFHMPIPQIQIVMNTS